MEGLIFYWFFWIFWVITTFFLSKANPVRFQMAIWLLLCIILSAKQIQLFEINWSAVAFFIMISTNLVLAGFSLKKNIYVCVTVLIVLIAYVSFLMFELYDPVLLIFKREWMLSFILVYLVFLLHKDLKTRMITLLMGTIHGEVIYAIILKNITIPHTVGSLIYLDVIALATAMILFWFGLEQLVAYYNYRYNVGNQKEKTT